MFGMYDDGDDNGISLVNPAQARPYRPRLQLATTLPQDQQLLAPMASDSGPGAEPPVSLDEELKPFRSHVQQTDQALQDAMGHLGDTPVPKLGTGKMILGGILSSFLPALGQHILNEPMVRYQADLGQKKLGISALENASRIAERDLQTAQTHQQQRAAIGWYNRRQPVTDARTITVLSPDDQKPHLMQFNPETTRFDIDAGLAYEKPQKEPKMSDIDFFKEDPEGWQKYWEGREKTRSKYDRSSRPTEAEFRYNLYKKDPKAYRVMYGRKDSQFEGQAWMRAFQGAKDELGDIDYNKAQAIHDNIMGGYNADYSDDGDSGAEPQVAPLASHGPAGAPPRNSSTGGQGVRYYNNHPYKMQGGQWVRQD